VEQSAVILRKQKAGESLRKIPVHL